MNGGAAGFRHFHFASGSRVFRRRTLGQIETYLKLLSFGPEGWGDEIARGVWLTVSLALVALPLGLVIGFFIALAKETGERTLVMAANIYTTIFRGLPELLTLFLVYYGVPIVLNLVLEEVFGRKGVDVNSFVAGVIALGIVFSAYASEAFASAFRGISKGQYEAGHALGLSSYQTMRRIVLPQLIKLALAGLSNLWLILLKETSLCSAIGLDETLRQAGVAARVSKELFLFFGVAFMIYLILSILSSYGLGKIDAWAKRGEVGR